MLVYCNTIERDFPLTFSFVVKNAEVIEERLRDMGLPPPLNGKYRRTRLSIFSEAVNATESKKFVSYSRRKNYYSVITRYHGTEYSYTTVTGTIDQAVDYDLIEDDRAKPGSHLKRNPTQSRMRATPELMNIFRDALYEYDLGEVIRLRDVNKKLQVYKDTDETRRMRSEIERINDFLDTFSVTIPDLTGYRMGRFIKSEDGYVPQGPLRLYRVFCRGSFSLGGRCYGWWQNLSKELRSQFLMNDSPVVELDYSQIHATILYAEKGIELPDNWNPYNIPGYEREQVKMAFNVVINARSENKARAVIQKEFDFDKHDASNLIRSIKERHQKIKDKFCSDAGVELMRIDADIIITVMLSLIEKNIPFLPVHDSIITPKTHEAIVKKVMIDSFSTRYPGVRCNVK